MQIQKKVSIKTCFVSKLVPSDDNAINTFALTIPRLSKLARKSLEGKAGAYLLSREQRLVHLQSR